MSIPWHIYTPSHSRAPKGSGFSLVELMVVLALVAACWIWLAGQWKGSNTGLKLEGDLLEEMVARTRLEAITRQTEVKLGIRLMPSPTALAVAIWPSSADNPTRLTQVTLSSGVTLNSALSSAKGTVGVLSIESWGDEIWAVWPSNAQGQPCYKGGIITLKDARQPLQIQALWDNEGALRIIR